MKAASAGLIALLASGNTFVMRETYTITLVDGTILTYTIGEDTNGYAVSANEPQAPIIT